MRSVFSRLENVFRREPPGQTGLTAELVHVRVPVQKCPQQAPDPIRQGDTPARPAVSEVTFWWHDQTRTQEDRFTMGHIPRDPRIAGLQRGRMSSDPQRVNIPVPSHVAYGSLFQYAPTTYGYN